MILKLISTLVLVLASGIGHTSSTPIGTSAAPSDDWGNLFFETISAVLSADPATFINNAAADITKFGIETAKSLTPSDESFRPKEFYTESATKLSGGSKEWLTQDTAGLRTPTNEKVKVAVNVPGQFSAFTTNVKYPLTTDTFKSSIYNKDSVNLAVNTPTKLPEFKAEINNPFTYAGLLSPANEQVRLATNAPVRLPGLRTDIQFQPTTDAVGASLYTNKQSSLATDAQSMLQSNVTGPVELKTQAQDVSANMTAGRIGFTTEITNPSTINASKSSTSIEKSANSTINKSSEQSSLATDAQSMLQSNVTGPVELKTQAQDVSANMTAGRIGFTTEITNPSTINASKSSTSIEKSANSTINKSSEQSSLATDAQSMLQSNVTGPVELKTQAQDVSANMTAGRIGFNTR
ncbi:uncharacterized protein LOC111642946 [Copidosoma floridanum]|uniref:uncharacterized protein LOC111642946 n=1 Tax=Copidosoma floridanum TaxID=29053 RepID=UPI000C6F5430|nr:uncharacterized protein LOC111642946 [Copidosoma floridanum]